MRRIDHLMISTHVSMTTFAGGTLYFRVIRQLSIDASNAFKAEMLSENRQLMGILGLAEPLNCTCLLKDSSSAGKPLIRGLFKMPSSKTALASRGTE